MAEPSSERLPLVRLRLAARWLALGSSIDAASLAFTLLALAALLWTVPLPAAQAALLAAAVAGLGEKAFALRVGFDRGIFADWARRWESPGHPSPAADLAAFDAVLADLGLRRAGAHGLRSLEDRIRGALELLKWQAGLAAIQAVALLAAPLPGILAHFER